MEDIIKQGNASDHLANERTYLAWIRTSVGIMAFGFVVVKFSLFVKQISLLLGKANIIQSRGYSAIVGIVLVAVGTITAILSYIRFKQTEKQLKQGNYNHSCRCKASARHCLCQRQAILCWQFINGYHYYRNCQIQLVVDSI